MTTILPSARTPFDVVMEQMGQQLGHQLPRAAQQYGERQRGLSAIDELQAGLKNAGGDINKVLPLLMKAYTNNPSLERSGLGQQYLQSARNQAATNPVNEAIGGGEQQPSIAGMATNAAQQMGQQPQVSPQTPQKNGQGLFLNNFIPQNIGELITPEQKTKMLSDVASKNGDVNLTRQLIDDYNQGKIGVNELANANVDKQAANVQRMLGFEDQIKKKIDQYIPQDTPEAEKNIYYNMLRPVLEKESSFSDAWQKVSADIDNFRKMNEAYVSRIPKSDSYGIPPDKEKALRNSAQPMLKIDPLAYNTLEQAYIQKGHSPITPAKILKPLPQNVKGVIGKAGDYKDLIYSPNLGNTEFPERLMERNIEKANQGQQSEIPKLASSLRKDWNEDLSLLNMYADLKAKGWALPNINQLFDDMADLFGTRQQAERNMLNESIRVPIRYLSE
jgi:hypothetical protein